MSAPNPDKGARYLAQLDASLCAGAWPDIAESARKVDKHAPDRACLTLAARAEAQIASASHRPTSASSSATSSIHSLGELIPKLNEAIGGQQRHVGDADAAAVCLAEIHWLRGEEDEALEALRRGPASNSGSGHAAALGWQEVCDIKASFIKCAVLEAKGEQDEARRLYLGIASHAPGSRSAELRRWTERSLARACMFIWRATDRHSISSLSDALRCFQSWSDFWQRAPPTGPANASHLDIARREVWEASYHLLSIILQQGLLYAPSQTSTSTLLVFPSDDLSDEQSSSARLRQRTALKRVEATYESLLLSETQFPKASQANVEVEEWVERAIANWNVFCGPQWTEAELGDGGQEAMSRGVLEILYRASAKTFHSTAILRQLFTVHASLGDFDLALHAFDSYVEIVSKGKTRAEKTGKHEIGFDSDDTAVRTAAHATELLCQYGDRQQAEKANEVVKTLRKWLGQRRPGSSATVGTANGDGPSQSTETSLQPKTLAAAHRAIGCCRSHWARLTFDNEAREHLRGDGIKSLRQAQAQDPQDIGTSSALALALAEGRDVTASTQAIRNTIAAAEAESDEDDSALDYTRERRLMPLWHLLALCRTANEDYEQAAKMCEAAFEQYGDSSVLFGERGIRTSVDSARVPFSARGVVDQMGAAEKEGILQIKMTQTSLIELMEGPDTAVRSSEELLALYTRLFGSPSRPKAAVKAESTAVSSPPSRSGGTLRSIAGSIRPRSRSAIRSGDREHYRPPTSIAEERPSTAVSADGKPNQVGAPISITVTNEDGVSAEKHHRHLPFKLRGHHHDSGGVRRARSNDKFNEKALPAPPTSTDTADFGDEKTAGLPEKVSPIWPAVARSEAQDSPTSPQQPLGQMAHNAPHDTWPPPPGHRDQPPEQDVRLPVPHPASSSSPQTHITGLQERQHKVSLLVEVWLFIAGIYLRADHFDDCTDAVDAAFRLVEQFEVEVAAEESSARRFHEKRWGLGKSVDELWGDVWAAVRSHLTSTC